MTANNRCGQGRWRYEKKGLKSENKGQKLCFSTVDMFYNGKTHQKQNKKAKIRGNWFGRQCR